MKIDEGLWTLPLINMWPGTGCEETVSRRGKFTEPSDLTSALFDTLKTARIKSPRKSFSKLTCIKQSYTCKSVFNFV